MIDLKCGDCLELMKSIPNKSVDLIVTDPPYGKGAEQLELFARIPTETSSDLKFPKSILELPKVVLKMPF